MNLAGDTVREISVTDLNAALKTATCAECNVALHTFHHDVTPLPNGHWLVLANTLVQLTSTTTPPLTNKPATYVLGDVIVDLDENMNPVWAWNEFNHLDPNRHPYHVSRLDPYQRGALFAGRWQYSGFHPPPELDRESGLPGREGLRRLSSGIWVRAAISR